MNPSSSRSIEIEGFPPFEAREGQSLAAAIERGGVDISHRCGGQAKCTTCRVVFSSTEPPQNEKERASLEEDGVLGQFRLSCQIPVETISNETVRLRGLRLASIEEWEPGPELPY